MVIDVQQLDADFLALSAHKFYGPTGIGILFGKEKWLNAMPPYQSGGEMIDLVTLDNTTFNELPFKFEAGTPNFADAIAWGSTIDFISQLDKNQMFGYEEELWNYAYENYLLYHTLKFLLIQSKNITVLCLLFSMIFTPMMLLQFWMN